MTFETSGFKHSFSSRARSRASEDGTKTMSNPSSKGVALITGASTGIGAIYADRLAKRGYDLILVARNEQRLNAAATHLRAKTGAQVTPLPADLNDKASLAKVEAALRENPNITMLVNNAGVGS